MTLAGFAPDPIGDSLSALGATWTSFYCSVGDGLQIEVNHRTHSNILDANTDAARGSRATATPHTEPGASL